MLCIVGEVPPVRYQGIHENPGPQYVRGIVEGNGDPPGESMWITYSMSKEDIWVSQIRVPASGEVQNHVNQSFEGLERISDLGLWNLYMPKWVPISLRTVPETEGPRGRVLELRDEEPCDYALAERIFPESQRVEIWFRVKLQEVGHALLEVEVQGKRGERPIKLRFDPDWLSLDIGKVEPHPLPFRAHRWYRLTLRIDCGCREYRVSLGHGKAERTVALAAPVKAVSRLVFRTGPWRGDVRLAVLDGEPGTPGLDSEDRPGADFKVTRSVFRIDDVATKPS